MSAPVHFGADLPRTDGVRHPSTWLLYRFRWSGRAVVRAWYDIRLHGAANIPSRGPVILCSNHIGFADGPLLTVLAPRPVHALTKVEMFHGPIGRILDAAGQIPLDRDHPDIEAITTAIRVLRADRVVSIYPEGARGDGEMHRFAGGAAYLGMVTGAPIVPVIMLGSRLPGHAREALPPRGSRIDIVFGEPFQVAAQPWPRTREDRDHVTKLLREHMLVTLDEARTSTGRDLPGPLPTL